MATRALTPEVLVIFRAGEEQESAQAAFFDSLEDLLAALAEDNIPPDDVHTITHNTRSWLAIVRGER
jgi:hypothetical protein